VLSTLSSRIDLEESKVDHTRHKYHSHHVCGLLAEAAGSAGITFRQSALLNFYASKNSSPRLIRREGGSSQ